MTTPATQPGHDGTAATPASGTPQTVELAPPVAGQEQHDLSRADVMALALGARLGVGALLVACLLAVVMGASSILASMEQMEGDLQVMSENLAISQQGLDILNKTMASVPPTAEGMAGVVATVESLQAEVATSRTALNDLGLATDGVAESLDGIAANTERMAGSLDRVDASTEELGGTVNRLSTSIGPLVANQQKMRSSVVAMEQGTWAMNDSLAYVIRILNYMAAPPTGEPFTIRVDPDKRSLPNLPGLKVESDPVPVFDSPPWKPYGGR